MSKAETDALIEVIHVSNFWPEYALKSLPQSEVPPDTELKQGTDSFGKPCRGIVRDASTDPDVLPKGVKPLKKECKQSASRTVELDRSDQHVTDDQGRNVWKLQQDRLDISVETEAGSDGIARSRLVNKI